MYFIKSLFFEILKRQKMIHVKLVPIYIMGLWLRKKFNSLIIILSFQKRNLVIENTNEMGKGFYNRPNLEYTFIF